MITGEVGTGKTLLVRCLLSELRKNNIAFGYVFNPLLPVVEFFQYIMADFGLPYSGPQQDRDAAGPESLPDPASCPRIDHRPGGGRSAGAACRIAGGDSAAHEPGNLAAKTAADRSHGTAGVGNRSRLSRTAAVEAARLTCAASLQPLDEAQTARATFFRAWSVPERPPSPLFFPTKRWQRSTSIRAVFRESSTTFVKIPW